MTAPGIKPFRRSTGGDHSHLRRVRFFFCSKTVLVINQLPDFFALCEIRRKLLVLFNTREATLLESPKLVNAQPYNFGHEIVAIIYISKNMPN